MALYNLYSHNVVIQYKSSLLSKATFFTFITVLLNIILPFIIANRSKGLWLRSHYFYDQPQICSTYEYLLIAETDEPSINIVCGQAAAVNSEGNGYEENCAEIQIEEHYNEKNWKTDTIEYKFNINIPDGRVITSIILLLGLDYQIMDVCPLQMQALAVITKDFGVPPNGFKFYGDIHLYQTSHLPCVNNVLDIRYNNSIFKHLSDSNDNIVDSMMEQNLKREVTTSITTFYSRAQHGQTGTMDIKIILRVPETKVTYIPSILQEFKWAWPQYLSLYIIFYWVIGKLRKFIFFNRLLMAWEIVPWKRKDDKFK